MKHGPNVRALIVRRMATVLVPASGTFAGALARLASAGGIESVAREATDWVAAALAAVKAAPDNPYGDDDERIAGVMLEALEAVKEQTSCITATAARRSPGTGP